MSSDKIREWIECLPSEQKAQLDRHIDEITKLMDEIVTREETLSQYIKRLASLLSEWLQDSTMISGVIRHLLHGIVSDSTIYETLGEEQKKKYKRYQDEKIPEAEFTNDKKQRLTVSNSGSESVTDPDGEEMEAEEEIPTKEQILETSAEIALSTVDELTRTLKDTDERLKEAFALIDDKDKEIERQRLQLGELEIRISDLQKKGSKVTEKNVDAFEDLQVKYDEIVQAYKELREVEMLRTQKEDFKPASQVKSPPIAWLAAVNLSQFCRVLLNLSMNLTLKQLERKILFDVTDDGQIKNPRPEG